MSLEIKVKDAAGKETGKTIELPSSIFDVEPNIPLMHQVVTAQLAAARSGSANTKTRGEVRGGGKKPYRQKGTGRARQGSIRAPQFAGGGVVHGPKPRSFAERTPRKMKAAALAGALTDRVRGGNLHVVSYSRPVHETMPLEPAEPPRGPHPRVGPGQHLRRAQQRGHRVQRGRHRGVHR